MDLVLVLALVRVARGQAVADLYLRTARVRKTAMITIDQSTDASTGCCIGQASGTGYPGGRLPNSSRQPWTVALKGFHSAMCRSSVGMFSEGTKAFEMNVSYNSQTSPPEVPA